MPNFKEYKNLEMQIFKKIKEKKTTDKIPIRESFFFFYHKRYDPVVMTKVPLAWVL